MPSSIRSSPNAHRTGLPDSVPRGLFWLPAATVLATSDNPGAADPVVAVEFARKAVELTGHSQPEPLQVLGVACAAAGRIEDAVNALGDALVLARSSGKTTLAAEIQENLRQLKKNGTLPIKSDGASE